MAHLRRTLWNSNKIPQTVDSPDLMPLHCGVQYYPWGDKEFIPHLLQAPNLESRPHAELWMGAHPDLPSKIEFEAVEIPVNLWIANKPERILGPIVASRYGQLPYMLKVLSVASPLSIQVHPSSANARAGYARENDAHIAIDAPNRNYRDGNHKPELLVALTEFWGLKGFRPMPEIHKVLTTNPELSLLKRSFVASPAGQRRLFEQIINLPQAEIDALLDPFVCRLSREQCIRKISQADPTFWLLRSAEIFCNNGHWDRGLLLILLLNLVCLHPGEAIYLPSGVPHCYLKGVGMEIMANSNNVLRGGLTSKHVDATELLDNVLFDGTNGTIIRPFSTQNIVEFAYQTDALEFELSQIQLYAGQRHCIGPARTAEILVLMEAAKSVAVTVDSKTVSLSLQPGKPILANYGTEYTVATTGNALLYRATVPT